MASLKMSEDCGVSPLRDEIQNVVSINRTHSCNKTSESPCVFFDSSESLWRFSSQWLHSIEQTDH